MVVSFPLNLLKHWAVQILGRDFVYIHLITGQTASGLTASGICGHFLNAL